MRTAAAFGGELGATVTVCGPAEIITGARGAPEMWPNGVVMGVRGVLLDAWRTPCKS